MTPIQKTTSWFGWVAGMSAATLVAIAAPVVAAPAPEADAVTQSIPENAIAQSPAAVANRQLAGQWHLKDFLPVTLNLVFTEDGRMYILLPSFIAGNFSRRGDSNPFFGSATAYEFRYQLKPNTSPLELDLIVPGSNERVKTIVEFIDEDRLRVEYLGSAPGEPRPTEFTTGSIILEKASDFTKLPQGTIVTNMEMEANKARESEARSYVGSMARAQQAYFLENEQFAATLEDLKLGIQSETDNYRYQIVPQEGNPDRILATATAKRAGLRSYASAVFVVDSEGEEKTTQMDICVTKRPSRIPPAMPTLTKAEDSDSFEVECAAGSERYSRF